MKRNLPALLLIGVLTVASACSKKYYQSAEFERKTARHKLVAVLPAEMVFTGVQPRDLSPEDIARIEEWESKAFQEALYNSILKHANTRKYITTIHFQDVGSTRKMLEQNKISIRDSWNKDDKELAQMLGVDAVVRMRIRKQRYMSDLASYGIGVARQIVYNTGIANKIPVPYISNKTNDIYASCNLVSENETLWNNNYKSASDWNSPANEIIENIADNFGKNFPYKQRK